MNTIWTIIFLIIFMIVLIFLSGWFSGTETALTNIGSDTVAKMKKEGDKNAKYVMKLKRRMDKTLVTILIGNNIVNIVLSSVAALIADKLFAEIGVTIMVGLITFLVILFGEITPKNSAIFDSRKKANRNSRMIYYLSIALTPLVAMFIFISGNLIRLTGGSTNERTLFASDQTIKDMAILSEQEGIIKPIEREIIHKVFIFGDQRIKDVMVPMKNVFFMDRDISANKARGMISERGFTRIPVMGKDKKVTGVLYSKDLLTAGKGSIEKILRDPYFVSENDEITEIFDLMKKNHIHIAIVKDESDRHVGVVTLEDILEELVGEIYDEYYDMKFSKRSVPLAA